MSPSGPERLRLDDQLCFALYAATNAVTRAYRPLLGALGLTYPQYLLMLVLWRDGDASVHEIATRLKLGSNAITPLIDQLEAAGFVARVRGAVDRRVVRIVMTEAGQRLEPAVIKAQRAVVCRTGLSESALAALRRDLVALIDRIAADGAAPRDEPARRLESAP